MFVLYLVYSCLYISYIGITFYFVYSYSHCISYMILHYISYLPIHIILHFIYSCSYYISYIGIHIVSYIGIMLYYIFIYYIILYYIILYYIILFRVFNVYLGKYIKYIISVVLCYSDPTFDIEELLYFCGVYRNPPSDGVCIFPVPQLRKFVAMQSAAKSFGTLSSTALPANCLYVKRNSCDRTHAQ